MSHASRLVSGDRMRRGMRRVSISLRAAVGCAILGELVVVLWWACEQRLAREHPDWMWWALGVSVRRAALLGGTVGLVGGFVGFPGSPSVLRAIAIVGAWASVGVVLYLCAGMRDTYVAEVAALCAFATGVVIDVRRRLQTDGHSSSPSPPSEQTPPPQSGI